jgi:DNA modification methylase
MCSIEVKNADGMQYLTSIPDNSIDLILTDPPYIISKSSGMDTHYNNVKINEENNVPQVKTEEEWAAYKKLNNADEANKNLYLKYGTIYGKKYCVKTNYARVNYVKNVNSVNRDNACVIATCKDNKRTVLSKVPGHSAVSRFVSNSSFCKIP